MEQFNLSLPSGETIVVSLDRKKMKTSRLKVYPNLQVVLALPASAPDSWAKEYLESKAYWIASKLDNFKRTSGYAATSEIRNGYSIQMFGEDLVFSVAESDRDYVFQEGKLLHVCSTDITDQEKLTKLFQKWWRKKSTEVLEQRVDYWYPIIEKYGISKPRVFIRKMATMWGSCSLKRGAVIFNLYLLKARVACIDYVVLHELTHFLYPNHSKQFYDFLSNYMPDWKERKRVLDQDVVHGL